MRLSAAFAFAIVCLLAAGCGGSSKPNEASPTNTAVAVAPTVGPPAIITGNLFQSVQHGYELDFPIGWEARENYSVTPTFAIDAFLAPTDGTQVQASISVTCTPAALTDATSFVDARRQFAKTFAQNGNVDDSPTTLAGGAAVQLRYVQVTGGIAVRKTEVNEFVHACGFSVTLTEDPTKDYGAVFQKVLQSFQFAGGAG